jgi:hypothetical protein
MGLSALNSVIFKQFLWDWRTAAMASSLCDIFPKTIQPRPNLHAQLSSNEIFFATRSTAPPAAEPISLKFHPLL